MKWPGQISWRGRLDHDTQMCSDVRATGGFWERSGMQQTVLNQHPAPDWHQHIYRFGQVAESLRAEASRETDATLKGIVGRLCEEVRHVFLELQQVANHQQVASAPDPRTTWRDFIGEFGIVAVLLDMEIRDKNAEPARGGTRYMEDATKGYMLEPSARYIEDLRDLYGQVRDLQRQLWELRIRAPEPPPPRPNKRRVSRAKQRASRVGRLRRRRSSDG
jgi:hypothetical protein